MTTKHEKVADAKFNREIIKTTDEYGIVRFGIKQLPTGYYVGKLSDGGYKSKAAAVKVANKTLYAFQGSIQQPAIS